MKFKTIYSLSVFLLVAVYGLSSYTPIGNEQDTSLKLSMDRGEKLYQSKCLTCHMANGQGLPSVYPPLVKTENLGDKKYLSQIIKKGLRGTIVVNGITYKSTMEGTNLTAQEIADVINYIRNSWGNEFDAVSALEVDRFVNKADEVAP